MDTAAVVGNIITFCITLVCRHILPVYEALNDSVDN